MPKYLVVGTIRCTIEADSATDAEGVLSDLMEEMGCWEDGMELESIDISDAVEVDDE